MILALPIQDMNKITMEQTIMLVLMGHSLINIYDILDKNNS